MDKARAIKHARNVSLAIVGMIVLVVIVGVAYTWYMGRQPVDPIANQAPAPTTSQPTIMGPIAPNPDAPVGASVQMISSPVVPGSNTTLTVKTTPTAICTVIARYDDVVSTDSGLREKTADEYGLVSWTWTVEESVPLGTWPVTATCTFAEKTGVVRADLTVKATLD